MAKHHISTTINGDSVEFLCETQQTLLDILRDELGLTGSKEGCASGDCGACSVMVNDRLVCSCLVLGSELDVLARKNAHLGKPRLGSAESRKLFSRMRSQV